MKTTLKRLDFGPEHYELFTAREYAAFPMENNTKEEAFPDWFDSSRNISSVYVNEAGEVQAFVAALMMSQQGWEYVHNQDPEVHFDEMALVGENSYDTGQSSYGIYILMIEKLNKEIKYFTKIAYTDTFAKAKELAPNANLIGLAGYSVGEAAIHLAMLKHGRHDAQISNTYMLFDPQGNLEGRTVETHKELKQLLAQGYKVRNKCHLSSVRTDQPSVIWEWRSE